MTDVAADDQIAARMHAVGQRIATAAAAVGRSAADITLVAVSKTHPVSAIEAAYRAGARNFGENRVQEFVSKRTALAGLSNVTWHFVGRLQRNKAKAVVGSDVLVHSVDRVELLDALQSRAEAAEVNQRVLVQVNVGDDPAKGGCEVHRVADLVAYADGLSNIRVEGLMTMPPLPEPGFAPADAAAPYFAQLRSLRDELRARYPQVRELSMGMSADAEAAIAQGATMVRIGTDVFGARRDNLPSSAEVTP
ncbi:MAG: YggS family pyridoxal phosphate-dependent enzyme [Nitriliruptoraceae bacterium]